MLLVVWERERESERRKRELKRETVEKIEKQNTKRPKQMDIRLQAALRKYPDNFSRDDREVRMVLCTREMRHGNQVPG